MVYRLRATGAPFSRGGRLGKVGGLLHHVNDSSAAPGIRESGLGLDRAAVGSTASTSILPLDLAWIRALGSL